MADDGVLGCLMALTVNYGLMWCRATFRVATVAASTQEAADHERRHQLTSWLHGLFAQCLCNFMADDGVLGCQMMPLLVLGWPWCDSGVFVAADWQLFPPVLIPFLNILA